jgi:outer membrane protein
LRVFIGYDFTAPVATEDLLVQVPQDNEIESFQQTMIQTRPEFAQFAADRLAAEQDAKIARSDRRPQLNYSIGSGFISDSLKPKPVYNSLGVQATIGVTIPIFDKGAKSRETQARLKIQQAENNRLLAERQFAQEFFTARTQAVSARARIRQLAASLTDAEANVSASIARYRAGEAPITEVTDANNLLVAQRQALYQAIFDYQSARAKLLRAIGK